MSGIFNPLQDNNQLTIDYATYELSLVLASGSPLVLESGGFNINLGTGIINNSGALEFDTTINYNLTGTINIGSLTLSNALSAAYLSLGTGIVNDNGSLAFDTTINYNFSGNITIGSLTLSNGLNAGYISLGTGIINDNGSLAFDQTQDYDFTGILTFSEFEINGFSYASTSDNIYGIEGSILTIYKNILPPDLYLTLDTSGNLAIGGSLHAFTVYANNGLPAYLFDSYDARQISLITGIAANNIKFPSGSNVVNVSGTYTAGDTLTNSSQTATGNVQFLFINYYSCSASNLNIQIVSGSTYNDFVNLAQTTGSMALQKLYTANQPVGSGTAFFLHINGGFSGTLTIEAYLIY